METDQPQDYMCGTFSHQKVKAALYKMFHYFRTVKHMNEFMLRGLDLRNLNSINIQNISKSAIIHDHGEKHMQN